jgi:cytosine deaminase
VKELWLAGVNVSIAHDDIRTPFYPLGTGSMLQAAHMAAHLAHMTGREEVAELVRMITTRAANTLQLKNYGFQIGYPASFIMLSGEDAMDLIREQPSCRYVVSQGRIVVENQPVRTQLYTSF